MMLTDLAAICRNAGLATTEVSGWRTRGHGEMHQPETIVCHHTAGPATGNMPSLHTVTYGRSDLPGPLCNLALGRDGTVYVVAAGLAYHAGVVRQTTMGNAYSIGIEAEATGRDSWPPIQMEAYAQLCKALCDAYGIPVLRVLGHKEVCAPVGRKVDPNFDMAAFRRQITNLEDDMATAREIWDEELGRAGDRKAGVVLSETLIRTARIEAALSALAAGISPTVEAAVKEALADAVVDVDVTVHGSDGA